MYARSPSAIESEQRKMRNTVSALDSSFFDVVVALLLFVGGKIDDLLRNLCFCYGNLISCFLIWSAIYSAPTLSIYYFDTIRRKLSVDTRSWSLERSREIEIRVNSFTTDSDLTPWWGAGLEREKYHEVNSNVVAVWINYLVTSQVILIFIILSKSLLVMLHWCK